MEKIISAESFKDSVWHSMSPEETIDLLNTNRMRGLTSDVAQKRLIENGSNELIEAARPSFWHLLWNQMKEFLVVLLIIASIVSLLLGDYIEAAAIIAIVILNAVLGVVQESRAEEALAALKKMTAPEATVIRDGTLQVIPSKNLVPGDVVILETGNFVPADIRLTEAVNLQITEASLTGESLPVQKKADTVLDRELPLGDRNNTAYMSTTVTYGRGRGVVVSTGMNTQLGVIAQLVQSFQDEPTPLQKKLDQLGRVLGIAALAICALVFLIGVGRYLINPISGVTLSEELVEMFMIAVSLAIAAVPEGLPAVVTICLALGMQRMIKRHALLRQLSAVEALGSATVICSDKTGTLTQNEMTVVKLWTDGELLTVSGEGYEPKGNFYAGDNQVDPGRNLVTNLLLKTMLLCNDAYIEMSGTSDDQLTWRMVGDPTEGALVVLSAKAGFWKYEEENELPRVAEIPFDSERKLMTTIHQNQHTNQRETLIGEHKYLAMVKGAPDVVLEKCAYIIRNGKVLPLTAEDKQRILDINVQLSSQALRVLGGAIKPLFDLPNTDPINPVDVENGLIFSGMVGMIDPPRPEVKTAIEKARNAGIKTVMITGDYPDTARAIAEQVGLLRKDGKVLHGSQLDHLSEEEFDGIVDQVDVYARVSPQHKVRIVEGLQSRNQIVSMTGDGVNDAPALKRADIGVAMGITGTDVSKEASSMVLTDDNFASIVSAIEEGRIIYSNIRKFVFYLLSCNVGEILIIFLAALFGFPLPLTAIQLLVLNLVTDGAPALALGLEKGDPDIMDQMPRRPDEPVVNKPMVVGIVIQAIAITSAVLFAFLVGMKLHPDNLLYAQTMAFATLSISELLRAYTSRSERYSVFRIGIFSNRFMQYAVISSIVILVLIIYVPFLNQIFQTVPMNWNTWLFLLPLIFFPSFIAEITKWVQRKVALSQKLEMGRQE